LQPRTTEVVVAANSRNVCQFIRRHANKRHKKHPRQTGTKSSPCPKHPCQPATGKPATASRRRQRIPSIPDAIFKER